jgi:hypothetical protein
VWPLWACVGLRWPSGSGLGLVVGLCWPSMVVVGPMNTNYIVYFVSVNKWKKQKQKLTVGFLGCRGPMLAFVGCRWPPLAGLVLVGGKILLV